MSVWFGDYLHARFWTFSGKVLKQLPLCAERLYEDATKLKDGIGGKRNLREAFRKFGRHREVATKK